MAGRTRVRRTGDIVTVAYITSILDPVAQRWLAALDQVAEDTLR